MSRGQHSGRSSRILVLTTVSLSFSASHFEEEVSSCPHEKARHTGSSVVKHTLSLCENPWRRLVDSQTRWIVECTVVGMENRLWIPSLLSRMQFDGAACEGSELQVRKHGTRQRPWMFWKKHAVPGWEHVEKSGGSSCLKMLMGGDWR